MGVTIVLDGQAGSCGKGKFIGLMATMAQQQNRDLWAIDNFMTNAGHTYVADDGRKIISQHIPTSIINPQATLLIGPGAAIDLPTLERELTEYEDLLGGRHVWVHPRAMVITQEHVAKEKQIIKSGSTFKGCGAACADKIMRVPDIQLFGDHMKDPLFAQCYPMIASKCMTFDTQTQLNIAMDNGGDILIEGSQGFDLDINYGLDYPHVTSRQCNAGQLVADCGIAPHMVTDVIMVIRPYPIRINSQSVVGERYSGDYAGAKEITWAEVKRRCGAPDDIEFGEMTTVTKRQRRVFEFNPNRFMQACMVNRPTWIALNFAQYLAWDAIGVRNWDKLPMRVMGFIDMIESLSGIKVAFVGTGAKNGDVCVNPFFHW